MRTATVRSPDPAYRVERRGEEIVVTYRGNLEKAFPITGSEHEAYDRAHEYVQETIEWTRYG